MSRKCKLAESTYGKVTRLASRVAATVGGTTADAKSRAVGLDVTKTLAVVALLGWIWCKHMSEVARASRI